MSLADRLLAADADLLLRLSPWMSANVHHRNDIDEH